MRWLYDYFSPYEIHKHAIKKTIYQCNSKFQEIEILDTATYGRCLILDNEVQSFETDEFIYHEAIVNPALVLHPNPVKVAVIGGGEGSTLREVLRFNSVKSAYMIDIDAKVVECAKEHLPTFHEGCFNDSRATIVYEDGRKFIENSKENFDVIVIDITCPRVESPAHKLFTKEFYLAVLNKLTPNGIIAVQASTTFPAINSFSIICNTINSVFPNVFPYAAYVPSFSMLWGYCLATRGLSPFNISNDDIDKRVSERITGKLRYYDGITHQALFSLPKYVRNALSEQTEINMDNKPFVEMYPGHPNST